MSTIPQWIATATQERLVRLRARDLDSVSPDAFAEIKAVAGIRRVAP
ncbi:MAG: hypothetical protein ACRDQI_11845 [Pseudonocardiaceae bacterium]